MTRYYYQALTPADTIVSGTSEQPNREKLLEHLRLQGLRPLMVRKKGQHSLLAGFRRHVALSDKDTLSVLQSLLTLLTSDVSLEKSLQIVFENEKLGTRNAKAIQQTLLSVRSGASLADSFKEVGLLPAHSSKTLLALIAAGEASGSLATNLHHACKLLSTQQAFKKKIGSALTYPMIVTVTALFTLLFMGAVIAPAFQSLFESTGEPLPAALSALTRFSEVAPSTLIGLLATALITKSNKNLGEWLKSFAGRSALNLPVVKSMIVRRDMANFCFLLAALQDGGVNLISALRIAAGGIQNHQVAILVREKIEAVSDGQSVSEAIGSLSFMPPLFKQLTAVGEAKGALAPMLHQISKNFRTSLEEQLETLAAVLSPALICLLGGLVAVLMASLFGAILDINDLVG